MIAHGAEHPWLQFAKGQVVGYRYALVSPIARDFDAEFRPELTPPDMLRLGVFGGNR